MKITREMREAAEKNGINEAVLYSRVRLGWSTKVATTKPVKKVRPHHEGEYAIYNNGEIVVMGTAEECAKELGVTTKYIRWLTTPTSKRRAMSRKDIKNATTAVKLDD